MTPGDPASLGEVDLTIAVTVGQQVVSFDWVRVMVVRVTIDHPTGDPTSPAGASATNEFVYGWNGNLEVDVRVKVEPDDEVVREFFTDKLRYEIDAIADSHQEGTDVELTWENEWDSNATMGKGVYVAGLWESLVIFTGLPPENDDFGLKTVTVQVRHGADVLWEGETEVEVFFPRDEANHPGDDESAPDANRSPNWFYYWKRAVGVPPGTAALYNHQLPMPGNQEPAGATPAMVLWQPPPAQLRPKNEIWLGPLARLADQRSDGSNQEVTGIDWFANAMYHEAAHVYQIAVADALLASETGTMYANGWSWLLAGGSWNNRFLLGTDGKPGVPDHDDDGGGEVDDTDVPVELGWGWPEMPQDVDDVPLDTDDDFLPDSLDTPDVAGPEAHAGLQETIEEGTFRHRDWAAPGKQHRTDAYDD